MADTVNVFIVGHDRVSPAARQSEAGLERLAGKMRTIGTSMTRWVTLPILAGFGFAVKAASDLNESTSKSDTIFGRNAAKIREWASTAATSFGLSKRQALETAASFGNMFNQLDIGLPKATKMSQQLVELAADFASFHNADITEVLIGMQAAFRGEYDALQRFVPQINAALVAKRAMADTGKDNINTLTAEEKALATYELIIDGAGKAVGDFNRTKDEAANRARTVKARWEDAAAALGTRLLPMATKFLGVADSLAGAFTAMPDWAQDFTLGGLAVAAATGPLLRFGAGLITIVREVAKLDLSKFTGLLGAFAGGPGTALFGTAAGITAVAAAGFLGVQALEQLNTSMGEAAASAENVARKSMRELRDEIEHIREQAEAAERTRLPFEREGSQAKLVYDDLIDSFRQLADENTGLATKFLQSAAAADLPKRVLRELRTIIDETSTSKERAANATLDSAHALIEEGRAAELTKDQIDALQQETLELVDAQLGLEGAQLGVERAWARYNETLSSGTASDLERREAEFNLKQAVDQLAASVLSSTNTDAAKIAVLRGLQAQYPVLAGFIQQYIDTINRTPGHKNTVFTTTGVTESIQKIIDLKNWIDSLPPLVQIQVSARLVGDAAGVLQVGV